MIDDEALEILFGGVLLVALDAKSLGTRLTLLALLPAGLRTLVTSDVDVFRREELDYFGKNIVDKGKHIVIACTKHIVGNSPYCPDLIRTACAAKMRIGSQCSLHVARKVNLWDDGDVALSSVVDDVANFVLGIESAIRDAVILAAVVSDDCLFALRANFGQAWIFLDFETPALIVGQMPVHTVHIVESHHVDECLYFIDGEEVTAHIEVSTTIVETRCIADLDGWKQGSGARSNSY